MTAETFPFVQDKICARRVTVERLIGVVGDELAVRGFNSDSPNGYGLALERLIDGLNRIGFR